MMIGCDKCDEWYHPACVGLDITQIPNIEEYDFICPKCKAAEEKKHSKNHSSKKSAGHKSDNIPSSSSQNTTTTNKRTAKAS